MALQHPKVLSAVAKALVRKSEVSPIHRKNRVGQLVRFPGFSQKVEEIKRVEAAKEASDSSRQPIYSESFTLALPGVSRNEAQIDHGFEW